MLQRWPEFAGALLLYFVCIPAVPEVGPSLMMKQHVHLRLQAAGWAAKLPWLQSSLLSRILCPSSHRLRTVECSPSC